MGKDKPRFDASKIVWTNSLSVPLNPVWRENLQRLMDRKDG